MAEKEETFAYRHYRDLLWEFDTLKVIAIVKPNSNRLQLHKVEAKLNTRTNVETNRNRDIIVKLTKLPKGQIRGTLDNGLVINNTIFSANDTKEHRELIELRNTAIGYKRDVHEKRKPYYTALHKEKDKYLLDILMGLDNMLVNKSAYEKGSEVVIYILTDAR